MAQRSLYDLLNGEFASGNPALAEDAANPDAVVARQRFVYNFAGKNNIQSNAWDITESNSGDATITNDGLRLATGTTNASYCQIDFDDKRPFDRDGCSVIWSFKGGIPSNATANTGWIQLGIGNANGNSGAIFFVTAGVHSGSTAHQFALRTMRSESFSTVDTSMANDNLWHTTKVHNASDGDAIGGAATLWIDGILRATCSTNLQSEADMQPIGYLGYGNDGVNKTVDINYCEAYNT